MLRVLVVTALIHGAVEALCQKYKGRDMYPLVCMDKGKIVDQCSECPEPTELCKHGAEFGYVMFTASSMTVLSLALPCKLPLATSDRKCTPEDFSALGLSIDDPTAIYQKLFIDCHVSSCHTQNYMTFDGSEFDFKNCYSLFAEAPLYNVKQLEVKPLCESPEEIDDCVLPPVCPDDPNLKAKAKSSGVLVKAKFHPDELHSVDRKTVEFETLCEPLCDGGKSNVEGKLEDGRSCQRMYSTESNHNRAGLLPLCESDEEKYSRDPPKTCIQLPICLPDGGVPAAGSAENVFLIDKCQKGKPFCTVEDREKYICDKETQAKAPCSPEMSAVKNIGAVDCKPLPLCASGDEKDCAPPLQGCNKKDAELIHCAGEISASPDTLCELYATDSSVAEGRCAPLPLCLEKARAAAYGVCEELCTNSLITSPKSMHCRQTPTLGGKDPLRIIERVKSLPPSEELAAFLKAYGDASGKPGITQESFEGRPQCGPLESLRKNDPKAPQHCNAMPVCDSMLSAPFDPFFAFSAENCVQQLSRCSAAEMTKYKCKNIQPPKPYCDKYEVNVTLQKNCRPRLMCEDFRMKRYQFTEAEMLQEYFRDAHKECEEICDMGEISRKAPAKAARRKPRAANNTRKARPQPRKPSKFDCRRRPSTDNDPWGVAEFDKRRFRPWCSLEDSVLKSPPSNCNPYPLCIKGRPPQNGYLNPYYSINKCAEKKILCSLEEYEKFFCSSKAPEENGVSIVLVVICITVILLLIGAAVAVFLLIKAGQNQQTRTVAQASATNQTDEIPNPAGLSNTMPTTV